MNINLPDVESAAADVCAASVVLHKCSKRVLKAREEWEEAVASKTPYGVSRRNRLAILRKGIEDAESAELAAEESWEQAIATLEEAEADEEAA